MKGAQFGKSVATGLFLSASLPPSLDSAFLCLSCTHTHTHTHTEQLLPVSQTNPSSHTGSTLDLTRLTYKTCAHGMMFKISTHRQSCVEILPVWLELPVFFLDSRYASLHTNMQVNANTVHPCLRKHISSTHFTCTH